jgi:hypothetical protein
VAVAIPKKRPWVYLSAFPQQHSGVVHIGKTSLGVYSQLLRKERDK